MRLIFIGPPGAGKGTQASLFSERFKVPHLSTGDMLRRAVASETEIGREAKASMESGMLVSDTIVDRIVGERLTQTDCANGYLLYGYPRNVLQAKCHDRRQDRITSSVQAVICFEVDPAELIDRISGRYSCTKCETVYHDRERRPLIKGVCDMCANSHFKRRSDDNRSALLKRLEIYSPDTSPVIDFYEQKGILTRVNGISAVEVVSDQIELALQSRKPT